MLTVGVILLSVASFLGGSIKGCRWTSAPADDGDSESFGAFDTASLPPVALDSPHLRRVCPAAPPSEPWDRIENACLIFFTVELGLRFLLAGDVSMAGKIPTRRQFVMQPFNALDFLAVAPFYAELIITAAGGERSE